MSFGGMNVVAILLAAIAATLWSTLFHAALAKRAGETSPRPQTGFGLLVTAFLVFLVMAWVLAGTVGHLGVGQVTLRNGVISALFLWAGFVATVLALTYRRQGLGWRRVVLDALHWLGALLLIGTVIGGLGV